MEGVGKTEAAGWNRDASYPIHLTCAPHPPTPEGLSVPPFVAGRRKEREKQAWAGVEWEGALRKGEGRCWERFGLLCRGLGGERTELMAAPAQVCPGSGSNQDNPGPTVCAPQPGPEGRWIYAQAQPWTCSPIYIRLNSAPRIHAHRNLRMWPCLDTGVCRWSEVTLVESGSNIQ